MTLDSSRGLVRTSQEPVLFGSPGSFGSQVSPPYYDRAHDRWLPAPRSAVSPAGNLYSYAEYPRASGATPTVSWIHVVEVSTAKDQVVAKFDGYHEIANFSSAGIYLLRGPYVESPLVIGARNMLVPDAMVLLDPASGAMRTVLPSSRRWSAFSSTSAWATDYDSADPSSYTALASSPPANRIVRLDLAPGSVSVWSNHLGYYVQLMGIGAGDQPVVVITEYAATHGLGAWVLNLDRQ